MNFEKAKSQITFHEGSRAVPYQDTVGVWTVGIGHNMSNPLSSATIDQIFQDDFNQAYSDANTFSWFHLLSDPRQRVITDMLFQFGMSRFKAFKNTIKWLEVGECKNAAIEMRDSEWWRDPDTHARAERLAVIMETNFDDNIWR